jgi:F0F1-type ATP synthase delta subunit
MIGTIAPDSLVTTVADTIIDVALTNKVSVTVRRKAVLCLSRILKKFKTKYDEKKFVGPVC